MTRRTSVTQALQELLMDWQAAAEALCLVTYGAISVFFMTLYVYDRHNQLHCIEPAQVAIATSIMKTFRYPALQLFPSLIDEEGPPGERELIPIDSDNDVTDWIEESFRQRNLVPERPWRNLKRTSFGVGLDERRPLYAVLFGLRWTWAAVNSATPVAGGLSRHVTVTIRPPGSAVWSGFAGLLFCREPARTIYAFILYRSLLAYDRRS
ncbi:hypothetical protein Micbo1qcDRAFT_179426 [Microdochium bolleyi]|uniref:Uncharacterized protein n=1 Tax=Microdochium bolleyi TaxID=196109 RepID=A0A136IQK9_9PEZI|nr:hypothetical protein Micbo1qcDRAFT_179426 [Microdochium bolleyi]